MVFLGFVKGLEVFGRMGRLIFDELGRVFVERDDGRSCGAPSAFGMTTGLAPSMDSP